jgi:hypothetical protein
LLHILGLAAAVSLGACAGAPRSTRLTAADLVELSEQMATKLRGSEWMGSRDGSSEPVRVVATRVENLSSDLIPKSEQWYVVSRAVSGDRLVELGRDKNLRFVIPAELLREANAKPENTDMPLPGSANNLVDPTHELSATIRSATRSAMGSTRTDLYLCEFRVTRIGTGELAWADTFELKRAAFGRSFD